MFLYREVNVLFREENFKFKQIYCDIPTGFGKYSQRYIDFIGIDDSISTPENNLDITDDINENVDDNTSEWLDYHQLAMFSDESKNLLGEVIFDEGNRKYQLKSIVSESSEMTIYQSNDDFLIYIYKADSIKREGYIESFEYLMGYVNASHIVLPIAILDEPYIGYVASNKLNGYQTLQEHLMKYMVSDARFNDYYKETDGLFKRYKIASHMAKFLEEIHNAGYCLGDIFPTEILVSTQKDSIVFMNANRLMRLPRYGYSELEKIFIAPEVKDQCRSFNSLTDTYALSKIIRFMLFPVINNNIPESVIEKFGDKRVTELLLDDKRMQNPYKRYSLSEIRDACLIASKSLYRCNQCHCWTLAHLDNEEECIWCHAKYSNLAGARFFEYVTTSDINPESNTKNSYSNRIGEMIFKYGKQTIDYRQMTNEAVGTTEKIPIAGIHYYSDGSITLVNLSSVTLFHTYNEGDQKKVEVIKPNTDRQIEVDVYRGNSRIYYSEDGLSEYGLNNTKVYQFFAIH